MMILGLSGGFDAAYRLEYDLSYDFMHDAAAVLLDEGRMVAAIEQERVNRIKHTNRAATPAARVCLETCGATIHDVDRIAFYATEAACNQVLYAYHVRKNVGRERVDVRTRLCQLLQQEFDAEIDPARLHFADHHMCHALGAYVHSGFDRCLTVTIDGAGEGNAGLVLRSRNGSFERLRSIPESDSLGYLYREVIRFLGYDMFEEYKVMGLAPYGDPAPYRDVFRQLYELTPTATSNSSWRVCRCCTTSSRRGRTPSRSRRCTGTLPRLCRRRSRPSCSTCCGTSGRRPGSRSCACPAGWRTTRR